MSSSLARAAVLALGSTLLGAAAGARERADDGFQELLRDEAGEALARGEYLRAEHFYWRLTRIDPDDMSALREAGRAAFAVGDLSFAERTLARVEELQAGALDPEVRYLRGQALIVLGRPDEGYAELAEAERQLLPEPPDRQSTLWLARIHAMRGEVARAEARYRTQLPPEATTAEHAEVILYIVEARVLGGDWRGAERLLRELLAAQPDHPRGQRLLAWVLEGNGKLDEELAVRAVLARAFGDRRDRLENVLGYARALERAGDDARALAMYREAERLGRGDDTALERTGLRQSPELGAGMTVIDDPSGSTIGWMAGTAVPLGGGLRLGLTGSGAAATPAAPRGAMTAPDTELSTSLAAHLLWSRRGLQLAAGPTLRLRSGSASPGAGGLVALRTPPGRRLEAHLRAQLGAAWRESTATVAEGGVVDSAFVDLFARFLRGRLVLRLSAEGRRVALEPTDGAGTVRALQLFAAGGADLVLWSRPARVARGQVFDEDMLWPSTFATGLLVSVRHNELASEHPFGARLVLVPRSRIEEISATFRYVLDDAGALAFELHGGVGPDLVRDLVASRAGGALLVSAAARSRLTASYDFASQMGAGLSGLRHTGWISFHVDL